MKIHSLVCISTAEPKKITSYFPTESCSIEARSLATEQCVGRFRGLLHLDYLFMGPKGRVIRQMQTGAVVLWYARTYD